MSDIDPFNGKPKEGITSGGKLFADTVEVRRKELSRTTKLSDLQEEFAIYTPAMVYLHVPLPGDFMSAFFQQYGEDVKVFSMELDKPVFSGLSVGGDKRWNHVLFGMPREHWSAFYGWAGTVAVMDRDSGVLYRVRTQEIEIADPFCISNSIVLPSDVPVGKISTFCVETNVGCHYYLSSKGINPAEAVFDKELIYEDTKRFAEAYQAGNNPYDLGEQNAT
jgi:hypothetical protein